jgi:hypothetical protein
MASRASETALNHNVIAGLICAKSIAAVLGARGFDCMSNGTGFHSSQLAKTPTQLIPGGRDEEELTFGAFDGSILRENSEAV